MTWIDWATGAPTCAVILAWLACVAAEWWVTAWVLLYVARGLAVLAGALYAVAGHLSALIPFGLLYLLLWGAHWLFPPTGPRELRHRAPRKIRPAPDYQAPGEWWRMYTVWAWHQNQVLAVLLWMAWGMVLAGLGLLATFL